MTAAPLPFFVYGTLRPGWGNARHTWLGRAWDEHDGIAFITGFKLLGMGNGFPYAVRTDDPTDITYGAIIRPVPGAFDVVLNAFDRLEGYPDHYDRVAVSVNVPNGDPARCYTYTPPIGDPWTDRRLSTLHPVPGGDWSAANAKEAVR